MTLSAGGGSNGSRANFGGGAGLTSLRDVRQLSTPRMHSPTSSTVAVKVSSEPAAGTPLPVALGPIDRALSKLYSVG